MRRSFRAHPLSAAFAPGFAPWADMTSPFQGERRTSQLRNSVGTPIRNGKSVYALFHPVFFHHFSEYLLKNI